MRGVVLATTLVGAAIGCEVLASYDDLTRGGVRPPGLGMGDAGEAGDAPSVLDAGDADVPIDGGSDSPLPSPEAAANYRAAILADHPIAYFRLADTSGPECVNEIDSGIHAVCTSVTFGARGIFGDGPQGAVRFPNDTVQITMPDDDGGLDFPGRVPFAFEVWIQPDLLPLKNALIYDNLEKDPGTMTPGIGTAFLLAPEGGTRFERWLRPYSPWLGGNNPTPISTTAFTHLVLTFDGTTLALYSNGSPASNANAKEDGGKVNHKAALWGGYTGAIDEIAIYAHALSAGRILAHLNAGSAK